MATKSQFINRPWVGWFNDADIIEITSIINNVGDGAAFNTSPAHGLSDTDNVQFIQIRIRPVGQGKQADNIKAYKALGYKGRRPVAAAEGILSLLTTRFWFGAQEWPFSGDGRGFVVEPIFRSDWVAGFNPIVYQFVRGDDNVTTITAITPFTLQLGTLASGDFPAARKVHFRESYRNDGVFTVASASGSPALVVMNENVPIKENDFGLIVVDELNVNYRLEVEVFRVDIDGINADENLTPSPLIFQSPQNGEIKIPIENILASQFDFTNDQPLTIDISATIAEHTRFIKFYIKTLEKWDGSSEVQKSDAAIFSGFAVAGTLEQSDKYGSNYADYVLNALRPVNSGKLVTIMDRPAIWRGFPFAIHFIWEDVGTGTANLETFNSAGGSIGVTSGGFTGDEALVRFMVDVDAISALAVTGDIYITSGGPVERSVRLPVDIVEPCENPIYLEWVNSLGGDSYWMFDHNYARSVGAKGVEDMLAAATNYLVDEERYTQTGGDRLVELTLTAKDIPNGNWEALSEIISSPRVNWIVPIDGNVFRRVSVRVVSRGVNRDIKHSFNNFEFTIGLPRREAQK